MTTYFLSWDLAFANDLVKTGLGDFQVGCELFNSKDISWRFIHMDVPF